MIAALVVATVKGSVLLVAALVATRLLRTQSASLRHAVWSAAILGQLALPALTVLLPASVGWTVPTAGAFAPLAGLTAAPTANVPPASDDAAASVAPLSDLRDDELLTERAAPDAPATEAPSASIERASAAVPVADAQPAWLTLGGALWIAGAAVFLLRLAVGTASVTRLARRARRVTEGAWLSLSQRLAGDMGITRPLALLRGDGLTVPVTWGVVYPAVLLPEEADEWPGERRRLVLLHELAHVKRFDALTQLAAQVVLALCWYNPLVWVAVKAMRAESERACDDYVLRGGAEASTYVQELLTMVRAMRPATPAFASLAMARPTEFEGRMLAILDAGASRRGLGRRAGVLTAAAALCLIVPLAAMRPAGTPPSAAIMNVPEFPLEEGAADAERTTGGRQGAAGTARRDPASDATTASSSASESSSWNSQRSANAPRSSNAQSAQEQSTQEQNENTDVQVTVSQRVGQRVQVDARVEAEARRAAREVTREMAAQRGGGIATQLAVPPLIGALDDADSQVRAAAVTALGSLGDPRAVEALARAVRTDTDARVREMAAHSLGQLEDARAVPALSAALREDRDAGVRNKAAWALGQIEDGAAVDALGVALRDSSVEVRRTAVWALGQIEDSRAVPLLTPVLRSEDVESRKQAAWALGQIESATAVEPLAASTKDESPRVREMAVWALGQIEDARALPALTAALRDPELSVRRKAVWAVGQLDGVERAPQGLIDALKDADPEVRKMAAHALGEIEDPAAVPGIVALSRDQSAEVRRIAAHALSEIRGPAAMEALIAMLKDADPEVRKMAAHGLGQDH